MLANHFVNTRYIGKSVFHNEYHLSIWYSGSDAYGQYVNSDKIPMNNFYVLTGRISQEKYIFYLFRNRIEILGKVLSS